MTKEHDLDKVFQAQVSKYLGWLSPASFFMAFFDWAYHFNISYEKQQLILESAAQKYQKLFSNFQDEIEAKKDDQRFANELWNKYPYNFYAKNFLLSEQLWDEATTNVLGVSAHHENIVNFLSRQMLDIISPSNFVLSNPEVIQATAVEKGANFLKGYNNFHEDIKRIVDKKLPVGTEKFKPGKVVAVTPGKVVFKNHLIELIQYTPTTKTVSKEPILIVPAWIMKYYILDLSPHNSMVKYLVEQGHTVFMISWRNPHSNDRNLGLDDYLQMGILDSIDEINKICPQEKINAVGYCIGGTLLMIAAAYLAEINDTRLNTITIFAAQVDFQDAGELLLFIDDSQITFLENIMWEKGYLDGSQMAGTFSMLNSVQLVWSKMIREYLLGDRPPIFDLMAWDYDTTRLPYRMHSEYLRKLFLNNELSQEKFSILGKNLSLLDIKVPIFAVSTVTDHVAPFVSVYKIHYLTNTDITFVLTQGGHNAGIVSEPGHPGRAYQIMSISKDAERPMHNKWQELAPSMQGSWWPDWHKWLENYSTGEIAPPPMGANQENSKNLPDAPGSYVLL